MNRVQAGPSGGQAAAFFRREERQPDAVAVEVRRIESGIILPECNDGTPGSLRQSCIRCVPYEAKGNMIVHVPPDARQVLFRDDVELRQFFLITDPGLHQELWRLNRPL